MTSDEKYCLEAIAALQREYLKEVQPYVDRLVGIKNREVLPHVIVSADKLEWLVQEQLTQSKPADI